MATATGSRQPRRRNGDQLRREPKARNCQTKEILPPNCKSVQKNKNNSGLQSPFLLTRLVHFQAAIWHNLSPLLTRRRHNIYFVLRQIWVDIINCTLVLGSYQIAFSSVVSI